MNDKNIRIIATVLIVLIVGYGLFYKFSPMISMKQALKKALLDYDKSVVENCEKIYRLESNNFMSGQFLGTYSAGMEPAALNYPWGWNSMKPFWDLYPEYKPIGLKTYRENGTGISKQFIQFPSVEAGVFSMCNWLTLFNNNPGRWFSTDATNQLVYNEKINKINATYTNEV